MAKRRSNTEGTIYRRSSGSWRAQIVIDGKRFSHSANTQAECRDWLVSMREKRFQGFNLAAGKIPLKEYFEQWLESIKSSRNPGTVDNYQ